MKRALLFFMLTVALALPALSQTATTIDVESRGYQLQRGTTNVGSQQSTLSACRGLIQTDVLARRVSANYTCNGVTAYRGNHVAATPTVCTAQPSTTSVVNTCDVGRAPPWTQTTVRSVGAAPACTVSTVRTPSSMPGSACQPVVPVSDWERLATEGGSFTVASNSTVRYGINTTFVIKLVSGAAGCNNASMGPDPALNLVKYCERWIGAGAPPAPTSGTPTTPPVDPEPPTTPPTTQAGYFFTPSGSNSNPGTQALPKRDLNGFAIQSLPAGTTLNLMCSPTPYPKSGKLVLYNALAREANRITIQGYGTCTSTNQAIIDFPTGMIGPAIEFGESFNDSRAHEGYTLRNLKLRKPAGGSESWGIWLKGDVRAFTFEGMSFEGFSTNINSQGGSLVRDGIIRNNDIRDHVGGHGILGTFTNTQFLDNVGSPGANGQVHAMYLSEGGGHTIRGNRIDSTSPCQGGGITLHSGYMAMTGQSTARPATGPILIDGNVFTYPGTAGDSCYGVSVSPYTGSAPGGFNQLTVSNNRGTNLGAAFVRVLAAPGAVITGNVSVLTTDRFQAAVLYSNNNEDSGDLSGPGTMTNNTACRRAGGTSSFGAPAGSTTSNNVNLTGSAASSGVCAP